MADPGTLPETTAERRARMLQALGDGALSLAMNLHARAMATEGDAMAVELAGAFHKVSRSVRQSLALEAQFEREEARKAKEAEDRARVDRARRVSTQSDQVRLRVERLIWNEADGKEAEALLADLDDLLELAAADADFLDLPVEILVARIAHDLQLAAQSAGEEAPLEVEFRNSA
jgi:hypothetical protein